MPYRQSSPKLLGLLGQFQMSPRPDCPQSAAAVCSDMRPCKRLYPKQGTQLRGICPGLSAMECIFDGKCEGTAGTSVVGHWHGLEWDQFHAAVRDPHSTVTMASRKRYKQSPRQQCALHNEGKKVNLKVLLLLVLLVCFSRAFAQRNSSFYVSTTGDDSNPGTEVAPWRSVQHAADTVGAGGTVDVRGGIYEELVSIHASGNASDGYITFRSYPGEIAILDAGRFTPAGRTGILTIHNQSYVRIEGFEIRNFRTAEHRLAPLGLDMAVLRQIGSEARPDIETAQQGIIFFFHGNFCMESCWEEPSSHLASQYYLFTNSA
jgi:hypothetical protein